MKRLYIVIAIALIVCFANQGYGQSQAKEQRLFYYVNTESAFKSLKKHIDQITVVSPKAYDVDKKGIVWGGVDPRVMDLAREHNVKVMPLLKNMGFNQALLHSLLSDSAAVGRMVKTLVYLCTQNKFMGIQFDFEDLNMRDKDMFTSMVRRAAGALHKHGFELSLAIVHRTGETPGPTAYTAWLFENWRGGYDLKKLADTVDFISVMTYSQHTGRTTPGPVAGLPWVKQNIKYFLRFVPPNKLSLGIPVYSKLWYTVINGSPDITHPNVHVTARSVDYGGVEGLIDRYKGKVIWDDNAEVHYAVLDNGWVYEYLWIEDARSFKAKRNLVKEYNLRGFSVWVLGEEDPKIWKNFK